MKKIIAIAYLSLICSVPMIAKIHIVLTAAITDAFYESRKAQYQETFSILAQHGYPDFYIIEALKKRGPTYLEQYSSNVFYAQTNNPRFTNHGANEFATLLEGLRTFNVDEDDMIIKFTGRHQLTSDYFLRLVEDNPEYDLFIKIHDDGTAPTLGFAMRYKHLIEMLTSMNLDRIGHSPRSIEAYVYDYIQQKIAQEKLKVYFVPMLYMKADLFGSSTCPNVPNVTNYY